MDYMGLIQKFKLDRPLTREEHELRLRQDERLEVDPHYQLSVIKANSTYMDTVDRYFGDKGHLMLYGLTLASIGMYFAGLFWSDLMTDALSSSMFWSGVIGGLVILALCGGAGAYFISREGFRHTHYPIRLNRGNRTLYVTRLDGSVFSVPWDEAFFTLGRGYNRGIQNWDIRGHVLAEDGDTVKETFAFSVIGSQHNCRRHWEFLRRYMEEGPEDLIRQVRYCMPVDGRCESFNSGWERICAEDSQNAFVYVTMYPLNFLAACARWVAMRTSRIPCWPPEVEAASVIDPDDPFIKDARSNPRDLR